MHDTPRHDFGFPGTRASDQLKVATAMLDSLLLGWRKFHNADLIDTVTKFPEFTPEKVLYNGFNLCVRNTVLVQPEMERGRFPLVSIPSLVQPEQTNIASAHRQLLCNGKSLAAAERKPATGAALFVRDWEATLHLELSH
jgi:hypothetical protein